MKLGTLKIAGVSLVLLGIQLAIVATIAGKYCYQRAKLPRVWVQTAALDPDSMFRGRYLSLRLIVDGCGSTLPSAKQARFQRNIDGTTNEKPYSIETQGSVMFRARLAVKDGRLMAIRVPPTDGSTTEGMLIYAIPGHSCSTMRLQEPSSFYIPEHANVPFPLRPGAELWMEVSVPSQGPPRPIQLALKQDGVWKPLAFQ